MGVLLFGSNKKIAEYSGWKPKYTLDEGLMHTIKWFSEKENLKHYKANIYNL